MKLLVKLFPLTVRPEFAQRSLAELRARYGPWDRLRVILFVLLVPYCAFALHEFFMWDTELVAADLGQSVYTVLPDANFWYAPAGVLGIILACVLTRVLCNWLLRADAAEYRYYSNMATGINASRLYAVFGVLLGGGFGFIALCAAHSSLQLTQDEIIVHRLFGTGEERYRYDRVRALRRTSHPDDSSFFAIEFDDAPEWSTAEEVIFPGDQEIAFLSQRTGKPVQPDPAR